MRYEVKNNCMNRNQILNKLNKQKKMKKAIIGVGVGNRQAAEFAEQSGADLIVIYNSGRFCINRRVSLASLMPYGDANEIIVDIAKEVLAIIENTPVLAGVCGTDPCRRMDLFLKQLKEMGFDGVQNFPTVGLCDGVFRQNLEQTGMGYNKEIEMIRNAHEVDMLTAPYVFNIKDAASMTKAGADILVAHMGLTTKGQIGAKTAKTLGQCFKEIECIIDIAKGINPDILVICHGGPISVRGDAEYVLKNVKGLSGFFEASGI
ncbi:MAG: phosphoenolpyruvate hydrolase family protein [Candidatus Humimicrobiaceae bacterium]